MDLQPNENIAHLARRVYTIAVKRARVLIVDDERPTVDILSRFLTSRGHAAVGAFSAEEALKTLASEPFDLILLDLVLPGITGFQALPGMLKLTKSPIHLMSGQTDSDTHKDAMALGASGFLPKPLDLKAVQGLLEALPPGPAT